MPPLIQGLIDSLQFSAEMFYEIWWALVLGFTISGGVQTFVTESQMSEFLGGRGVKETFFGAGFGFLSSSCSFAAVATSRSLFSKGASPEASLAGFQFASTNLVIELGLVLYFLLGFHFVVANFLGGFILIALLALVTRYLIPESWFDVARENAKRSPGGMQMDTLFSLLVRLGRALPQFVHRRASDTSSMNAGVDGDVNKHERSEATTHGQHHARGPASHDLRSVAGWKTAFRKTIKDWSMVASDVILGFFLAGIVATFVPHTVWEGLFMLAPQGSVAWVVLGCFFGTTLAIFTFLCSIGNVPFAVILWNAGIPFGGVISFIFGDLVVPQIDNIYRKYYGIRMALTLFVSIFSISVITGVIVYYIWATIGWIPQRRAGIGGVPTAYKEVLTIVFTALFLVQVYVVVLQPRLRSGGS
ncbi:permease [Halocatena halophila]|uniref:permease n=1 Tax=Halocatena halophila TaxID=2814576 RepID=UPI002ECFD8DC